MKVFSMKHVQSGAVQKEVAVKTYCVDSFGQQVISFRLPYGRAASTMQKLFQASGFERVGCVEHAIREET